MIKFIRGFIIFTSICCIVLYFYTGQMQIIRSNSLLGYVEFYTFFTVILLYPIMLIMFLRDLYISLNRKKNQYLYFLIIDVAMPFMAVNLYNDFFSQILT
jgi:hypothetical protein